MTAYADYEYYEKIFKGTDIPESSFDKRALEASSKINYYTFNRIKNDVITDEIRNATCFIAELLYNQEQLKVKLNNEKILSSETVGPHTKNYVNSNSQIQNQILNEKDLNKKIYNICLENLSNTGLMYKGF